MKNFYLIVLIILVSISAYAQESKLTIGEPYTRQKTGTRKYFCIGDRVITIKSDGSSVNLRSFDSKTMNPICTGSLSYYTTLEYAYVEDTIIHIFTSTNHGQSTALYHQKIDSKTLKFTSKSKQLILAEHPSYNSKNNNDFGSGLHYTFRHSRDSSKLLVHFVIEPEDPYDYKSHLNICHLIYDNKINEISKIKFTIPYESNKIAINDINIDNKGNSYIIAQHNIKNEDGNVPDTELYTAVLGNPIVTCTKLTPGSKKYIEDTKLAETLDGSMLCVGLYKSAQR